MEVGYFQILYFICFWGPIKLGGIEFNVTRQFLVYIDYGNLNTGSLYEN
jgi:hypothetical protein